jgi:hypothetical protein
MAVSKTFLTIINAPQGITNLPAAVNANDPVIKSTFDTLGTVVGELQGDVSTAQGDITTLQGDFSSLGTQVGDLATQVITNSNDIATIGGDVSTLNSTVGNLETDLTTVQGDISTLQGDVSTIQGDITTLQSEISAIVAPYAASVAYNSELWSTSAGVATLLLTNSQHGLGTSRMSDFSICVTEASGTLEADEDITSLGKVKRASNGDVSFEIDDSYLVSTFNTYVAVFA